MDWCPLPIRRLRLTKTCRARSTGIRATPSSSRASSASERTLSASSWARTASGSEGLVWMPPWSGCSGRGEGSSRRSIGGRECSWEVRFLAGGRPRWQRTPSGERTRPCPSSRGQRAARSHRRAGRPAAHARAAGRAEACSPKGVPGCPGGRPGLGGGALPGVSPGAPRGPTWGGVRLVRLRLLRSARIACEVGAKASGQRYAGPSP